MGCEGSETGNTEQANFANDFNLNLTEAAFWRAPKALAQTESVSELTAVGSAVGPTVETDCAVAPTDGNVRALLPS